MRCGLHGHWNCGVLYEIHLSTTPVGSFGIKIQGDLFSSMFFSQWLFSRSFMLIPLLKKVRKTEDDSDNIFLLHFRSCWIIWSAMSYCSQRREIGKRWWISSSAGARNTVPRSCNRSISSWKMFLHHTFSFDASWRTAWTAQANFIPDNQKLRFSRLQSYFVVQLEAFNCSMLWI